MIVDAGRPWSKVEVILDDCGGGWLTETEVIDIELVFRLPKGKPLLLFMGEAGPVVVHKGFVVEMTTRARGRASGERCSSEHND